MKRVFFVILFCCSFLYGQVAGFDPYNKKFKLICGSVNKELGQTLADIMGITLTEAKLSRFNDGEVNLQIKETIRGCDVFLLQSTCSSVAYSVNDNLMELFLLIRACKRASARSITAIIPYFGYARQDKKIDSRVPISASDVSMLIERAGADHVISLDLHSGQIQGFYRDIPMDNLTTSKLFVPYIMQKKLSSNLVVVSPDAGGVGRAKELKEDLHQKGIDSNLAIIIKQRNEPGSIGKMNLVGDVKGADAIIVDDICDTAGTLCEAAAQLKKFGAKKVYACITHPVFSDLALERIGNSQIDELVVSDSIPFKNKVPKNIKQISIANLLAEAIEKCYTHQSIKSCFLKD